MCCPLPCRWRPDYVKGTELRLMLSLLVERLPSKQNKLAPFFEVPPPFPLPLSPRSFPCSCSALAAQHPRNICGCCEAGQTLQCRQTALNAPVIGFGVSPAHSPIAQAYFMLLTDAKPHLMLGDDCDIAR